MKKIITLVLSLILALALLTACGGQKHYKVTFDLQGGTGIAPEQLVEAGEKAARPAVDPVYGEKYFKGWSSASGTFTEFNFDTAITKDTTIYAFWTDDAPKQEPFKVAFDLQGGTGTAPVQLVEAGEKAARPAVDPVYGEKYFKGWSSASGTFTEFNFDAAITKDTTIYAFWIDDEPETFEVAGSAYKWSYFIDVTEEWLAEGYFAIKLFEGGTGELIEDTDITPLYYEYNLSTKAIWIHSEEEPGGGYDVSATGILDGDTLTIKFGDEYDYTLFTMLLAAGSTDTFEIVNAVMYFGFDFVLDFKTNGSVKMDFMYMGEISQTVMGAYTVEESSVIIKVTDLDDQENIIYFTISGNSTLLTVDLSKGQLPLLDWMEDYLGIEITSMIFIKLD